MINNEILQLIRHNYPQLAEKALQEKIAEVGNVMEFSAGTLIQDYGSYIKMVPLVVKGSIKVLREDEEGNELLLYYLTEGETCSMSFSCCMADKKSDVRTITEDDSTIIGIPIQYMDEWMRRYASWKNFVMQSYDNRMRELVKTIDSIAFRELDERLLSYLKQRSEALNAKTILTTHQEIAHDLHASREAISRLLKALEKKGKIALSRNRIELLRLT